MFRVMANGHFCHNTSIGTWEQEVHSLQTISLIESSRSMLGFAGQADIHLVRTHFSVIGSFLGRVLRWISGALTHS